MKFLVQRVTEASVTIAGERVAEIDKGFLVLMGIAPTDTQKEALFLIEKLLKLRVFEDERGAMNLALGQVDGGVLAVSQFTLYADTRHGNRPGFSNAARPEIAEPLFRFICEELRQRLPAERFGCGVFGADMKVRLLNDGPVTIELSTDS